MGPRRWGRGRRRDPAAIAAHSAASMGPRRWGRGRRRATPTTPRRDALLQWGRDDGVAEDASWREPSWSAHRRFNGAATMGSRKTPSALDASRRPADALQWGRDDGVAEDAYRDPRRWLAVAASMGPRRWGRGRRRVVRIARDPPARLQWGRDDGVAEDDASRSPHAASAGFNGAATMGSRKTRPAASSGRFNGAATMGSRKTALQPWQPVRRFNGAATMGSRKTSTPRLIAHGTLRFNGAATMGSRKTSTVRSHRSPPGLRFNGAATMGSRKTAGIVVPAIRVANGFNGAATMGSRKTTSARPRSAPGHASMGPRRWGRGRRAIGRHYDRRRASMGPRRWGRGRRHPWPSAMPTSRSFNGAATMGSRKTSAGLTGRSHGRSSFNGAATMGSRKTRARPIGIGAVADASMGPRRWGRGRPARSPIRASATWSFNGAATMGSRKTPEGGQQSPRRDSFNGAATMGSRKTTDEPPHAVTADRSFNGAATMGSRKTARPPVPWTVTGCALLRERLPVEHLRRTLGSSTARPKCRLTSTFGLARGGRAYDLV